jgi:hypothetical protein
MSHNREKTWRTADGRSIAVKDMELSHLVNVVNWVHDNHISYGQGIRDLMVAEAKYRQVLLFAEGKEYPQIVDGKWKIINPKTGVGRIEKPPKEYIESVKDNPAYQAMSKRTQEKRKKESTK